MKKKLQLFLILLLACANCFAQPKADSAVAMHYKTNDFDCAIFPASAFVFVPAIKRFTPTKEEVDKAELALKTQLEALNRPLVNQGGRGPIIHKNLKKYGRQYFGYVDSSGHRILYINSIWKEGEEKLGFYAGFLKEIQMVMDGGSYYWNIKYDLDTNKLVELEVNGLG